MRIAAIAILLAGAAAVGHARPSDWSHAQTVTVQLSSFKFTPSTLILQRGVPYRLHLVNVASGGHDFDAASFFAGSTIAPEDRKKIEKGRVELGGGKTADIRLIPLKSGTFRLHCSHFMHATFGMKGAITVRQ